MADLLLSAEVIVLAGPAPDNPFKFVVKRQIQGLPEDIERLPEIPFLIDSRTRAAFRTHPENLVLFTYGTTTRDNAGRGLSRKWIRIFTLTPERKQFLEAVHEAGQTWLRGDADVSERVAFFAKYISVKDPILRDTALIELDRARYRHIQMLRNKVPANELLQEFDSITRMSFLPISIRLLGLQTQDGVATDKIRAQYPRALISGSGYLREWALAGIEVDGARAVDAIRDALGSPGLKEPEKRSLVRALADSGEVSPAFRDQIIEIFSERLKNDPALALEIAVAMRDWNETQLDAQLTALVENQQVDPITQFIIQTKGIPAD